MKTYLIMLCTFWYCHASASSINLSAKNFSEPNASILYTNYKNLKVDTLVKLDLNNGASIGKQVEIPQNGFYTLMIGKHVIPIFLEQRKDYTIELDYTSYPKNFKVNGSSKFYDLFYALNNEWVYAQKPTTFEETSLYIKTFNEKHANIIKSTNGLSKKEATILMLFLDGIINIMKMNMSVYMKLSDSQSKALTAHLADFSIKNELVYEVLPEKFLKSMLYNSFSLKYGENAGVQPVKYLNYINETVSNKTIREYLSAQFVTGQLRILDKEQSEDLLAKLQHLIRADHLIQAVANHVKTTYKTDYLLPNFKLYTKANKQISTHDFLGKIVLIDVWALWCTPCLEERPYLDSLELNYKESDKLAVIRVSIDLDRKQWLKDVSRSPAKNYWVDGGFKAEFSKALEIVSIPRFVILNEKGVVIHAKAPAPSSKELYRLIDTELERLNKN